jgi:hypothetical protein
MTISDYVSNKEIRKNLPYRYHGIMGMGYYFINGAPISDEEIEILYPIDKKFLKNGEIFKGKNSDRTKNWMHGDKSY